MVAKSLSPWRLPVAAVVLVLSACATPTGKAPPASTFRGSSALAVERQWLQSWFTGTPVLIVQRDDGPVRIDVPREFCFEPGQSSVKPALAAVLDKLAESLRRTPQARLQRVAAPGDDNTAPVLALQRATQVRQQLIARGVPATRLANPAAATAPAVQLSMELAQP